MSDIEIIPVEYGNSTIRKYMVFSGTEDPEPIPIVFMVYLLKTENKNILIDAGCETMPGFVMENFIGPVKALEKIGVTPADITDVVITHAHHDHIESVKYFKNANIYIQKDEYEDGKDYLSENDNIILFENEINVCENVKAVKIGGHSIGSCIVEIKKDDRTYVIAGDECYKRDCLLKQIPTGASVCLEKSKDFIKKYNSDNYVVLLCHDK